MRKRSRSGLSSVVGVASLVLGVHLVGCVFVPPPPLAGEELEDSGEAPAANKGEAGGEGSEAIAAGQLMGFRKGDRPRVGMDEAEIQAYAQAQGDPHAGRFSLEEALEGVEGDPAEPLLAIIHTSGGSMRCRLLEKETPKTVANFVGLARGTRAALHGEEWTKAPYYDGTVFHRVIPGFMIQGGDREGTGAGSPGYVISDEISRLRRFDASGVLAMANMGPATGGSQFFVTLAPTPHLNGAHTIFGICDEASVAVARAIAGVPRDSSDRPRRDVLLEHIAIHRGEPKPTEEAQEQPQEAPAAPEAPELPQPPADSPPGAAVAAPPEEAADDTKADLGEQSAPENAFPTPDTNAKEEDAPSDSVPAQNPEE